MRKVVFSAVVVVLAGACWVVAQNAATYQQSSPYRAVPAKGALPSEKAETLVNAAPGEPLVAPTTELDVPPPSGGPFRVTDLPAPSVVSPLDLSPKVPDLPLPSGVTPPVPP